mmetsp:Transcript_15905/g.30784  ORF Transcript_15905/g.30784 Transcript_15905/m.30784 type:complete len:211 (+) Transcript_15905:2292-2924(+)
MTKSLHLLNVCSSKTQGLSIMDIVIKVMILIMVIAMAVLNTQRKKHSNIHRVTMIMAMVMRMCMRMLIIINNLQCINLSTSTSKRTLKFCNATMIRIMAIAMVVLLINNPCQRNTSTTRLTAKSLHRFHRVHSLRSLALMWHTSKPCLSTNINTITEAKLNIMDIRTNINSIALFQFTENMNFNQTCYEYILKIFIEVFQKNFNESSWLL